MTGMASKTSKPSPLGCPFPRSPDSFSAKSDPTGDIPNALPVAAS